MKHLFFFVLHRKFCFVELHLSFAFNNKTKTAALYYLLGKSNGAHSDNFGLIISIIQDCYLSLPTLTILIIEENYLSR